jgi:predicted kinase
MSLIILRGPQGCGKTTLALHLQQLMAGGPEEVIHLEADQWHTDSQGNYRFDKSKVKEAHDACFEMAKLGLSKGCTVIVSNVFAETWQFEQYIAAAEELDIPSFVMLVEGEWGSSKDIPESTIRHTKQIWQTYAIDWLAV